MQKIEVMCIEREIEEYKYEEETLQENNFTKYVGSIIDSKGNMVVLIEEKSVKKKRKQKYTKQSLYRY